MTSWWAPWVSNHQPHECLLNRLFRRKSRKISKLRVTGLCEGNSPVTGEFPSQRASNAEYVSIWWRHHSASLPSGQCHEMMLVNIGSGNGSVLSGITRYMSPHAVTKPQWIKLHIYTSHFWGSTPTIRHYNDVTFGDKSPAWINNQ